MDFVAAFVCSEYRQAFSVLMSGETGNLASSTLQADICSDFLKPPSFRVKMPSNITIKVLIKSLYEQNLNYHLIKNRL